MTANPTFAGTVLPDCFVGVPYLAGIPVATAVSQNIVSVSVIAGTAPPGLTFNQAGYVTGNVQVTSSTGTQVDGGYSFSLKLTDAAGGTVSAAFTMNVHYLTNDQDLSVAAQAALRAGEQIDNTSGNAGVNDFPTSPAMPTDVG